MDIQTTVITEIYSKAPELEVQGTITGDKLTKLSIKYLSTNNEVKDMPVREDHLRFLQKEFTELIKMIDEKRAPKIKEECIINSISG